jgi:hypothetical protein
MFFQKRGFEFVRFISVTCLALLTLQRSAHAVDALNVTLYKAEIFEMP